MLVRAKARVVEGVAGGGLALAQRVNSYTKSVFRTDLQANRFSSDQWLRVALDGPCVAVLKLMVVVLIPIDRMDSWVVGFG